MVVVVVMGGALDAVGALPPPSIPLVTAGDSPPPPLTPPPLNPPDTLPDRCEDTGREAGASDAGRDTGRDTGEAEGGLGVPKEEGGREWWVDWEEVGREEGVGVGGALSLLRPRPTPLSPPSTVSVANEERDTWSGGGTEESPAVGRALSPPWVKGMWEGG